MAPVPVASIVTQMDSGGTPARAIPDPSMQVTATFRIEGWFAATESLAGHAVTNESFIVQRTLPARAELLWRTGTRYRNERARRIGGTTRMIASSGRGRTEGRCFGATRP